jgi:hypothetical protein
MSTLDDPTGAETEHWQRLADEIETHGLRNFVAARTSVPQLQGRRIVAGLRYAIKAVNDHAEMERIATVLSGAQSQQQER